MRDRRWWTWAGEALPAPGAVSPGRWTDEDLWALPHDGNRYEIVDGELLVTPSPATRHQLVVMRFGSRLDDYALRGGGMTLVAPYDVRMSSRRVVEPDVVYVAAEHLDRITEARCEGAPDLVVEVSSSSTRARDRLAKRALYESEGVLEYWFVDLDNDVIEVYRHHDIRYAPPLTRGLQDELTSPLLPGFAADVVDLLVRP